MGMSIGGGSPVQQVPTQTAVAGADGGGAPGKVDAGGAPSKVAGASGGGADALVGASGGGAVPGAGGAGDAAQGVSAMTPQLIEALTKLIDVLNQLVAALQASGGALGGGPTQKGVEAGGGTTPALATTATTTAPTGSQPAMPAGMNMTATPAAATTAAVNEALPHTH